MVKHHEAFMREHLNSEHQNDIDQLKTSMHRHLIEMHGGEERSKVEFGIKVLKYTRSLFERQILESLLIQGKRDHHIVNSRSEFNQCAIPRLVTKLGEKELKKWREEDKEMEQNEEKVEEQIRMLKKERNRTEQSHKGKNPSQRDKSWTNMDRSPQRSQEGENHGSYLSKRRER